MPVQLTGKYLVTYIILNMKYLQKLTSVVKNIVLVLLLTFSPFLLMAQDQQRLVLGLHIDPVISWFSSDDAMTQNNGARPGFNFGLTLNKYFTSNYSFSTGISLLNAGGRLISKSPMQQSLQLSPPVIVAPGESVTYKIQYLTVPVGLKLQSNQIGYMNFFSDIGLDPKVVINGKVDVPSLGITNERATDELNIFNLGYHITVGIEYSLGGNTALVSGLSFENNFLDITKDNSSQPEDKISHKLLSFKFGINF
jgi:hypothetical protein